MTVAPPWRGGTKAAARRQAAVDMLLAGRSLAVVRKEFGLDGFDERQIAVHLRNVADAEPCEPPRWEPGPATKALEREFGVTPLSPQVADEALAAFRACPGRHVAPRQATCMNLSWHPPTSRTARVRVLANTCEQCKGISYELCQAGGLRFIRRTDRAGAEPEVAETEHLPAPRIEELWRRLLHGKAR